MRILIADDNQFVRRGIVALLAQHEGWEVCGEASDSAETIVRVNVLQPDLVLLDLSMPGGNGLEITRALKQRVPETKILIFTQRDPKQILPRALEFGANGCVDKGRLAVDLIAAIRSLQSSSEPPTAQFSPTRNKVGH